MTGTAWIWVALAVPLLVAGAVCVARFVVGDRARGRLRCPKCWYDMGGGGEKCPECGRAVKSGRDLRRSRRRKRWGVAGVLLLALGCGSLTTRHALVHGAVSLVPDWMLIAGMEHWPTGGVLDLELHARHREGKLSLAEQRRMLRIAVELLDPGADPTALVSALVAIEDAEAALRDDARWHAKPWQHWVDPSDIIEERELALRIRPLSVHEDVAVREQAWGTLANLATGGAIAAPSVILWAHENPGQVRTVSGLARVWGQPPHPYFQGQEVFAPYRQAGPALQPGFKRLLTELRDAGGDFDRMRARLIEGLRDPDPDVRAVSLWTLRGNFWPDEEARLAALATYDPEDPLAPAIVDFAVSGPLDEPAQAVIRGALGSHDYEQLSWAVNRLGARGAEAAVFADDLRAMLTTKSGWWVATPFIQITGDRETVAKAFMQDRGEEEPSDAFILKLGEIGWCDEEVLALVRRQLGADSAALRLAAATTLLRLGTSSRSERAELTRIAATATIEKFGGTRLVWFGDAIKYGEADIHTVLELLGDASALGSEEIIHSLGQAGTAAEEALPRLRELTTSTPPNIAAEAELAVRRIEW